MPMESPKRVVSVASLCDAPLDQTPGFSARSRYFKIYGSQRSVPFWKVPVTALTFWQRHLWCAAPEF